MTRLLSGLSMLIMALIVGGLAAAGYAVYRLVERTIASIPRDAYIAAGVAVLAAVAILAVGAAIAAVLGLLRRARLVHHDDGIYPLVSLGGGRYYNGNEPGAQSIAAAAQARRPTAALAGRIIDAHYRNAIDAMPEQLAALPAPEPAPLTVASLAGVDLRTDPHWLLIGATGSGKTVASYAILSELASRQPCEFVICELGGVNWPQATATTTPEIVAAILSAQAEMERRQASLRTYGVDHVQDLASAPPYLVLVVEEIDATLDDLRIAGDRDQRAAAVVALRAIARMGRKAGVCLFAVSTSGTTDVFDAHVRKNMSTVLLFRSEHTVSETWRLPGVRLTDLASGQAYSPRHGATVQFPYASRPGLSMASSLRTAEPAQIEPPILVQNWPGTAPVQPVLAGSGGSEPVLAANEEPAPELADLMRQWYAAGASKNEICRRVWPAKNGVTWAILDRILNT